MYVFVHRPIVLWCPLTWYGSSMLGTSTERRAVPHNLVAAVPVVVMPLLARLAMVRINARKGIDGLRDKAYCPHLRVSLRRTQLSGSQPPKCGFTVGQRRGSVSFPHGRQHGSNMRHRSVQFVRN